MKDLPVNDQPLTAKILMEVLIRFAIVAYLIYLCLEVFAPFLGLLTWALIMAVALYPIHQKLAKRVGSRQGRASVIMVVSALLLFGVPVFMLGGSFTQHIQTVHSKVEAGTFGIEPPKESVAEWPIVGKRVYNAWTEASTNMPDFINSNKATIKKVSERLLSVSLNGFKSVCLLLGAFAVAGIMMAYAEAGVLALERIFSRVAGKKNGEQLQSLCKGTVRSVAVGVLGVAFIQSIIFGVGFVLCGIPAAGVLAVVVLLMGIVQLPGLIVAIPAIIFVWAGDDGSTVANVLFTIWFMIAALADNVLKPLLLGRGVDAPMPVILIGALGGMITGGFIGLFVGAVLLAVGYQVFMGWVHNPVKPAE